MQSVILSFLLTFFSSICNAFKKSVTYKLFENIYQSISSAWKNSIIVSALKKDADTDSIVSNSIIYKIFNSPFVFLNFLKRTIGSWLNKVIYESYLICLVKYFINNLLALNTRFLGVMLVSAFFSRFLINFILNGAISGKFTFIIGAIGALLCCFNANITSYFEHSKIIRFIQIALDLPFGYEFFKTKFTLGKPRIVLATVVGIGMGILFQKSALLALALPIGLFGLTAVLYAPIVGVYFSVFAAPFVPTMVLAMLCLLTLFSLIIKSLITPYFKWRFDGVGVGLIFLIVIFFISSLTSYARVGSLAVWIMYLVFMSFFFVIINTVKTKKQLFGLLKIFAVAAFFVALYGLMQYIFGWDTKNAWIDEEMFEGATMRVYSTLENPNVLGEYLLLTLPISSALFCMYKAKKEWLPKFVYFAITALLLICLILTQSRGCWLGFILATVIFVTFYNGRLWGLIPIALCILPFVLPDSIINRISSIGDMSDSSTSYRVYIWLGTLSLLKDFWLGGIGMGEKAFNVIYPFYSYNAIVAPHSHNLFLQLLTESGIVALVSFIVMIIVFIKKMITTYQYHDKRSPSSIFSLSFICGVLGFLLQSMFDYTFYNYRVMAMFFMFLAFGMSLKYITKAGGSIDQPRGSIE